MAPKKRPASASAAAPSTAQKRPRQVCTPHKKPPLIPCTPGEPLTADAATLRRLLQVMEDDILPKTRVNVAAGNKMFGAAIMKNDAALTTVVADSNHEMVSPIFHGEVWVIKEWSAMPTSERPAAADCVFLATHEPCCMCVSAIVWSGFKKCFYFNSYEDSRDQGIPHDINILHELWQVPKYATCNKFMSTASIFDEIEKCSDEDKAELLKKANEIKTQYEELAKKYHDEKSANPENTLAFG